MLIAIATFCSVLGIIVGGYWAFVVRPEESSVRALWTTAECRRTRTRRDHERC